MNPILIAATLGLAATAIAPTGVDFDLDVGECQPYAANIDYETEPVDSPFVPTPPPEEWEAVVAVACREPDTGTGTNRREVIVEGVWELDENSVDDIPSTVLDVMRQIVELADDDGGAGGVGPIVPPGG